MEHSPFYPLYLSGLQEIFWIESQMPAILNLIGEAAYSCDLKRLMKSNLLEVTDHREVLIPLFSSHLPDMGGGCEELALLFGRIRHAIACLYAGGLCDMSMIMIAVKITHYKIAMYESLITLAKILVLEAKINTFDRAVVDEQGIELLLTELSERYIYQTVLREVNFEMN